ncbi:copper chaperone PCu(A)C [Agaribacter flavus]|uniref:Copper chaperone PCu(A)C n=1 Tax=Agaribacter flavus TaxID=1902781 RepID=A0ABV7FRU5_9ALTE
MKMTPRLLTSIFFLAWFGLGNSLVFATQANTTKMSEIVSVNDAWARETFKFARTGAAYLSITNHSESNVAVLSSVEVDESVASMVELHETFVNDEVMSMEEIEDGIEIAPNSTVQLAPGGKHLMFMGLSEPFTNGQNFEAKLHFEDSSSLTISIPVKDAR